MRFYKNEVTRKVYSKDVWEEGFEEVEEKLVKIKIIFSQEETLKERWCQSLRQ